MEPPAHSDWNRRPSRCFRWLSAGAWSVLGILFGIDDPLVVLNAGSAGVWSNNFEVVIWSGIEGHADHTRFCPCLFPKFNGQNLLRSACPSFLQKERRADHTRFCPCLFPKFNGQNLVRSACLSFLKKTRAQITPDFAHAFFPNSLDKIRYDLHACLF